MLKKKIFRRLGWGGVATLLVVLWAQMPIIAQGKTLQKKTLEEQLREAKKVIDDQMWTITQLKDNFYQTTNDLVKEIDSLKASYSDQAEVIKPITEKYLEITEELNALMDSLAVEGTQLKTQVDSLTAKNAELERANVEQVKIIRELADKYLKVMEEFNALLAEVLAAKDAELEVIGVEQAKIIKEIIDDFLKTIGGFDAKIEELNTLVNSLTVEGTQLKAQVDSLTVKNAELERANAEQAKTIKKITDNFFKTTGELNAQIEELDTLVNSLTAEGTQLKAQVDSLIVKNAEFKAQVDSLTVKNAEFKAQVDSLTVKNTESNAQVDSLTVKNAEFKAQVDSLTVKNTESNAQIDSLTVKNAELEEANTEQERTIEEMTEDFFRVTGEINSEVTSLKAAKDEDMATIEKLKIQRQGMFLGIGVLVIAVLAMSK